MSCICALKTLFSGAGGKICIQHNGLHKHNNEALADKVVSPALAIEHIPMAAERDYKLK